MRGNFGPQFVVIPDAKWKRLKVASKNKNTTGIKRGEARLARTVCLLTDVYSGLVSFKLIGSAPRLQYTLGIVKSRLWIGMAERKKPGDILTRTPRARGKKKKAKRIHAFLIL